MARLTRRPDPRVLAGLLAAMALGLGVAFLAGDGDEDASVTSVPTTTTTLRAGGIEVDAPDGYRAIPLPSFDLGIAVPRGWQATRTDVETLASLEGRALVNPEFVPAARRAAAFGAVLYAAGVDDGRVNDAQVRIYARGGPTTAGELRTFAADLVEAANLRDASIDERTVAGDPAVVIEFEAGTRDLDARGTELLRVDRDRIVSVLVTSEDVSGHEARARAITASLVLR